MRVVAAYLLAKLGGNASPSAADIKKILGAVGVEAEDSRIELLLSEIGDKDADELIAEGMEKLAAVPAGGGGGGGGGDDMDDMEEQGLIMTKPRGRRKRIENPSGLLF